MPSPNIQTMSTTTHVSNCLDQLNDFPTGFWDFSEQGNWKVFENAKPLSYLLKQYKPEQWLRILKQLALYYRDKATNDRAYDANYTKWFSYQHLVTHYQGYVDDHYQVLVSFTDELWFELALYLCQEAPHLVWLELPNSEVYKKQKKDESNLLDYKRFYYTIRNEAEAITLVKASLDSYLKAQEEGSDSLKQAMAEGMCFKTTISSKEIDPDTNSPSSPLSSPRLYRREASTLAHQTGIDKIIHEIEHLEIQNPNFFAEVIQKIEKRYPIALEKLLLKCPYALPQELVVDSLKCLMSHSEKSKIFEFLYEKQKVEDQQRRRKLLVDLFLIAPNTFELLVRETYKGRGLTSAAKKQLDSDLASEEFFMTLIQRYPKQATKCVSLFLEIQSRHLTDRNPIELFQQLYEKSPEAAVKKYSDFKFSTETLSKHQKFFERILPNLIGVDLESFKHVFTAVKIEKREDRIYLAKQLIQSGAAEFFLNNYPDFDIQDDKQLLNLVQEAVEKDPTLLNSHILKKFNGEELHFAWANALVQKNPERFTELAVDFNIQQLDHLTALINVLMQNPPSQAIGLLKLWNLGIFDSSAKTTNEGVASSTPIKSSHISSIEIALGSTSTENSNNPNKVLFRSPPTSPRSHPITTPPPSPAAPPPPPPPSPKYSSPSISSPVRRALSFSEQLTANKLKASQPKKLSLPELDQYTYIASGKNSRISPEMQLKSSITTLEITLEDHKNLKAAYLEAEKNYKQASDKPTYALRTQAIVARNRYRENCSTLLKIVAPEEIYQLSRELNDEELLQYGQKLLILMQTKDKQNQLEKANKTIPSPTKLTLSKETRELLNKLNQARDLLRAFPKRKINEENQLSTIKKEYEEASQKLAENIEKTKQLEKEEDSKAKKEKLSALDTSFTTLWDDAKQKEATYKKKLDDLNRVINKKVEAEKFLKEFFDLKEVDVTQLDQTIEAKKNELIEKDKLRQENKPRPTLLPEVKKKKSLEEKQKSKLKELEFVKYLLKKEQELTLNLTPSELDPSELESFHNTFKLFVEKHKLAAQEYAVAQLAKKEHELKFKKFVQTNFIEIPIRLALSNFDTFVENERQFLQPAQFLNNLSRFIGKPIWVYQIDQCDFEQGVPAPNKQNRFGLESLGEPIRLLCRHNQLFILKSRQVNIKKISLPTIREYTLLDLEQGQVESNGSYKVLLQSELQKLTRSIKALQTADADLYQIKNSQAELNQVIDPLTLSLRTSQTFLEKSQKETNFENCHNHLLSIVFPSNLYEEKPLSIQQLFRYANKRISLIANLLNKIPGNSQESQIVEEQLNLSKSFKDKIRQTKQHLNIFLRRHEVQTNKERELADLQTKQTKFLEVIKNKQDEINQVSQLIESKEKNEKLLSLNEGLARNIKKFQEKKNKLLNRIELDTKKLRDAENHLKKFTGLNHLDDNLLPSIVKEKIKTLITIERFLILKKINQEFNPEVELQNAINSLLLIEEQPLDLESLLVNIHTSV